MIVKWLFCNIKLFISPPIDVIISIYNTMAEVM